NRCAKKVVEGEVIRDVATYCVGIARMLLLEINRGRAREARSLEEVPEPRTLPPEPLINLDQGVDCRQRCLGERAPENRELILNYYRGDKGEKIKNRKGLKELFAVPASTLRMRALRLRERLQMCAEKCMQQAQTIFS